MKNLIKILLLIFCTFVTSEKLYAEEKQKMDTGHKYNIYTGMFDFSDNGKKSQIIGIQHLNDNLFRDSVIGTIKPCLLYTSPSPRDRTRSRMPSSA